MFLSQRVITRRNFIFVVILFVLFLGAFQYIFYLMRDASGISTILDLYFHYTPDDAYSLLSYYGPEGRKIFLWGLLIDTIFPLIYGLFLWMSITFLATHSHLSLSKRAGNVLQLLPVLAVVLDYIENIFEVWMTLGYPQAVKGIASISGWVTTLKWIAIYINIFVIAFLVLIYLFRLQIRDGSL